MPDSYMNAAAVPVPDAGDDTLRTGLAWAMRGTVDGDLIDPDSEIPIGEAERLAYEFVREHTEQARADERERIMQVVKALPHGKTNETPWVPDFDAGWRQGRMDVLAALEGAATP